MRSAKWVAIGLMGAAALAFSSGTAAAQPAGYFVFEVCNKSDDNASMSVSARESTESKDFVIRGWWNIDAGECANIGTFPLGWVYFYAYSQKYEWRGSDHSYCVDLPGRFERYTSQKTRCSEDELKGFTARFVDNTQHYVLTLN